MNTVNFMGEVCTVEVKEYAAGGVCLQLWCEDGPMATATVRVPDYPLDPKYILIKDWAENKGVLKALVDAGIVRDTGRVVPTGYVEANVCKLLQRYSNQREKQQEV